MVPTSCLVCAKLAAHVFYALRMAQPHALTVHRTPYSSHTFLYTTLLYHALFSCLLVSVIFPFSLPGNFSASLWKVKVKVAQSCPTLCDPMNSTVHGILQARILKWEAFPFSRGSSQSRDGTQVSRIVGRFFTNWATRKPLKKQLKCHILVKVFAGPPVGSLPLFCVPRVLRPGTGKMLNKC